MIRESTSSIEISLEFLLHVLCIPGRVPPKLELIAFVATIIGDFRRLFCNRF